jgi:hypothetical protein
VVVVPVLGLQSGSAGEQRVEGSVSGVSGSTGGVARKPSRFGRLTAGALGGDGGGSSGDGSGCGVGSIEGSGDGSGLGLEDKVEASVTYRVEAV